jgi:ATP synthase protein I
MASDDANRPGSPANGKPSEAELSERLRRLGERLRPSKDEMDAGSGDAGEGADPSSLAKAMRLSTEFVAGIIAGAFLGWLADRFLGTSPWGLIVFLMLGFVAGIMNLMRASKMMGGSPPGTKPE